jgi:hypothetical protein
MHFVIGGGVGLLRVVIASGGIRRGSGLRFSRRCGIICRLLARTKQQHSSER